MSREDLFAHILSGNEWKIKHVYMLLEAGFVERRCDLSERYVVVKEFAYMDTIAKVDDVIATCPGEMPQIDGGVPDPWPEVLLLPSDCPTETWKRDE